MGLRVALTAPYTWPEVRRGGERYVHELAAALRRCGHDARIWSTAPTGSADRVDGVPVHRFRRRRVRPGRYGELAGEVGFGAQSLARLAAGRHDVWHATGTSDGAAAALLGQLRPQLRTVFTDHGFPVAASRRRRADGALHGYLTERIDAYVCVSQAAGHELRRDYGREPAVVPPGVRLPAYAPGPRHPRPVLLYAGDLTESRKNVSLLLAAAAEVSRSRPDVEVWLLGPGDPARLLAGAGRAAELVTRVGPVPDAELARSYAAAWVTVLPSVAEAFGMVVPESWASGTPVVVRSDSGGPAEIVTDDDAGRRVAGDTGSVAAGCLELMELAGRRSTAETCREHAVPYDWDRAVVPQLLELYCGT